MHPHAADILDEIRGVNKEPRSFVCNYHMLLGGLEFIMNSETDIE